MVVTSSRARRGTRGPGRPALTQTERVLNAVRRGGQDAKTIARMARVPQPHVHPLLNRLRAYGLVEGFTGSLKATGDRTPRPHAPKRNPRS